MHIGINESRDKEINGGVSMLEQKMVLVLVLVCVCECVSVRELKKGQRMYEQGKCKLCDNGV